jgi:hypothetical protein
MMGHIRLIRLLTLAVVALTGCEAVPERPRPPVGEQSPPQAIGFECTDAHTCIRACDDDDTDARIECVEACDAPAWVSDEAWLQWSYACARIGRIDDNTKKTCTDGLAACY